MNLKNDKTMRVQRSRISLHDGDSVYLRKHAGAELRVYSCSEAGAPQALLWITEEHEADDVFLRAGECHVLRGNGSVIATAWAGLQLRVVPAGEVAREQAELRRRSRALQRDQRCDPPRALGPAVGTAR
jgi:hypothetical protein